MSRLRRALSCLHTWQQSRDSVRDVAVDKSRPCASSYLQQESALLSVEHPLQKCWKPEAGCGAGLSGFPAP